MFPRIYAADSAAINKLAQFRNRKIDANPNDVYVIACDDTVYLGFAKLTVNEAENSAELKILKISDRFRNAGIGNFILSHVIAFAQNRKMRLYGKIDSANRDIDKILSLCKKNNCKTITPIGNLYSIGIAEWERFFCKTSSKSSLNYDFKTYSQLDEAERSKVRSYGEAEEYRHLYPSCYENIYDNDFSVYLFYRNKMCGWCIADCNGPQEMFIYSVFIAPHHRKYNAGIHLLKYVTFGNHHGTIEDIETVSFCLLSGNMKAINILDTFSEKGYCISKNEVSVVDFI